MTQLIILEVQQSLNSSDFIWWKSLLLSSHFQPIPSSAPLYCDLCKKHDDAPSGRGRVGGILFIYLFIWSCTKDWVRWVQTGKLLLGWDEMCTVCVLKRPTRPISTLHDPAGSPRVCLCVSWSGGELGGRAHTVPPTACQPQTPGWCACIFIGVVTACQPGSGRQQIVLPSALLVIKE